MLIPHGKLKWVVNKVRKSRKKFLYKLIGQTTHIFSKSGWGHGLEFLYTGTSYELLLSVLVYGCEVWSSMLREAHRLEVFKNWQIEILLAKWKKRLCDELIVRSEESYWGACV
jgi:hypothetical protein